MRGGKVRRILWYYVPSKRLSPEKFAHHVMVLFFPLRDEPLPLLFHWKKNRLNIYLLRNTITFLKYLKSYEVPQINDRFLSEPLIVL